MATDTATSIDGGITNFSSGSITSDNTAIAVNLGFTPRWVKVINSTDVIVWEKIEGMAAANSVKTVTAGTTTVDTGSAITLSASGFTISSGAAGNSKAISWVALG